MPVQSWRSGCALAAVGVAGTVALGQGAATWSAADRLPGGAGAVHEQPRHVPGERPFERN